MDLRRASAEIASNARGRCGALARRSAVHGARWSVRLRQAAASPDTGTEVLAGLAASLLAIAYCLSFSALLFQGELRPGLPMGLWALLVGSAITGVYVALKTSLPPVAAGPNNPAVAVLSVLAAMVSGDVLARGGSVAEAVDHVLVSLSLATLATGIVLYALGAFRLGQYVRFVPYPVIGGFLAASGWLLAAGGVNVVTGRTFDLAHLGSSLPAGTWPQVLTAFAFAGIVYALKAATRRMNVLPLAVLAAVALLNPVLWLAGLAGEGSGWYLAGTSEPVPWVPLKSVLAGGLDGAVFLHAAIEILSAAGVTVVALLLDVSGLEVTRAKAADLDAEFRVNGIANIVSAPLGGVMGKMSVNGTRLIDETGGKGRLSGLVAALFIATIAVTGLDLARFVPAPVLGGLLIYLGLTVLADVLLRSPAQRAWSDYALAVLIMLAIVTQGYLAGVILGFIGACLMFAVSYSRVAVIRRHLTREVFASNVDRSAEATSFLKENGRRIHVFWLTGYIFFGSAHRLFESFRSAIGGARPGEKSYAVLDFSDVSGFDTSALISLVKLRNVAEERGVTLTFAGLSDRMQSAAERIGLVGAMRAHQVFATRTAALEWCEDRLLEDARADTRPGSDIEAWLADELGSGDLARTALRYLDRRELAPGSELYRQGEQADSVDLIADGSVMLAIRSGAGMAHLAWRMSRKTVIGEMGFFRGKRRAGTVITESGAVVYTLSRAAYERMQRESPDAGAAFLEFIVRTLSDRLEFANSGISALS